MTQEKLEGDYSQWREYWEMTRHRRVIYSTIRWASAALVFVPVVVLGVIGVTCTWICDTVVAAIDWWDRRTTWTYETWEDWKGEDRRDS